MKAIKKIVALGIGATMVGATILGASAAASLNQYPAPFVKNGMFNGALIVGDRAAAEDVIGVSDILASLQYSVSGASSSSSSGGQAGDTFTFGKDTDKVNLWENLNDITQTLTKSQLDTLADGTFKGKSTEIYTQKLTVPTSAMVVWDLYTDISEDPALYLEFNASLPVVDYTLDFQSSPVSDATSADRLDDFENEKITIMGKEYTVTRVDNSTNGIKMTLMSGAIQDTLEVGQTKTYTINGKEYEVTVRIVSGDSATNAVTKIIVNDEVTKSLSKDDTETLADGLDIGIKEIMPTKSGDAVQNMVEFYLGAKKIVLDGSDGTIDIGDSTNIDGAETQIKRQIGSGEVKIDEININWTPTSKYYVPLGGSLMKTMEIEEDDEPLLFADKFGIDYVFAGLNPTSKEVVELKRNNDDSIKMVFTNRMGVEYDFPVVHANADNSSLYPGKDGDEQLYVDEKQIACKNDMFVLDTGTSDATSAVMEVVSTKYTDDTKYVKLKDIGTKKSDEYTLDDDNTTDINYAGYTFEVTYFGTTDCVNLTNIAQDGTHSYIWTKYGSKFNLTTAYNGSVQNRANELGRNGAMPLVFFEDKDFQEDDTTRIDQYGFNFTWDSTNSVADILTSVSTVSGQTVTMTSLDADNKKQQGYSKWGTFFESDNNGDQAEWKLTIPENQISSQIVVSTLGADVAVVEDGGDIVGSGQKIDVGATKLASEVAGKEKDMNLILVGGPCANAAVEAASDEFPTCSAWPFEAGEAIIQLVEQDNGNVALLVAGSVAADTRTATAVVHDMTKLKAATSNAQKVTTVSGQQVLTSYVAPAPEVEEPAADADAAGADAAGADADPEAVASPEETPAE